MGEPPEEPRAVLRAGPLALDRRRATAALGGAALTLTRSEFLLLAALWGERLVLAPWGHALELHASRLRAKLRRAAQVAGVAPPPAIESLRQVGYRLRA